VTLPVTEGKDGCTFQVRVLPRSRRDQVVGQQGYALKVRLVTPPVRGKANRALRELLAERLGISPSAVEVLSGHTSRQKRVRVKGVSADAIRALIKA
jgi:uncharacterized protein (TIGR00251 family)